MNKKEYNFFFLNIYIILIVINLLLLLFVNNNTRISASADALSWITPAKNFFLNHNFIENTEYSNQAVYRTPIIPIITPDHLLISTYSFKIIADNELTIIGLT